MAKNVLLQAVAATALRSGNVQPLAWALRSNGNDVFAATNAYESERRPVVESTQRAAQASIEWFEGIGRYVEQERLQFAFNLLTRSRRVTYDNLRLHDPEFVRSVHPDPRPPMFTPLRLRSLELANRVVVSPMDMYSAVDGTPGDFHLVHLGARALGGAGLLMTEMICVSDIGRITPGCAGMYREEHVAAWERIVSFAHQHGGCAVGIIARDFEITPCGIHIRKHFHQPRDLRVALAQSFAGQCQRREPLIFGEGEFPLGTIKLCQA